MNVTAWVIVFVVLGVLALIAVAACALPVWREGMALVRQLGNASESFETSFGPLGEALEQLGEAQGSVNPESRPSAARASAARVSETPDSGARAAETQRSSARR